jgi:hypothetical protein
MLTVYRCRTHLSNLRNMWRKCVRRAHSWLNGEPSVSGLNTAISQLETEWRALALRWEETNLNRGHSLNRVV